MNLGKNSLEKLTPEIGKLINLTFLSIVDNQLTELPAEIANLKDLETLSIYGNKLTDIPEDILELNILDPDWNLNDKYDDYGKYDEDDDY